MANTMLGTFEGATTDAASAQPLAFLEPLLRHREMIHPVRGRKTKNKVVYIASGAIDGDQEARQDNSKR